jgi:prepilin-type N-terminal cleavage/methylation domain-containing protein
MGFSLLEWLIVLAIVAMLAQMAATPLHRWVQQFQGRQQAQAFVQDLWIARQTAARFGQRAVLCGMDPLTSTCTTTGQWSYGRLLFVDHNNNGLRDPNEPTIKQTAALASGWTLQAGTTQLTHIISYAPTGGAKSLNGAVVNGHYRLCPPLNSSVEGLRVVINSLGRPRTQTAEARDC